MTPGGAPWRGAGGVALRAAARITAWAGLLAVLASHSTDAAQVGGPLPATVAEAATSAAKGAAGAAGGLDKAPHPLLAPLVPELKFGFTRERPTTVQRTSQLPPTPDPRDFSGRYTPLETTLLLPGERGRMASYTDHGARALLPRAQDYIAGHPRNDPASACKPAGTVRELSQGSTLQIMQSDTQLTLLRMDDRGVRRIQIGGTRVAQPTLSHMGSSQARWEGNTLVVETRGFRDNGWLDQYGDPSSDKLMLTERYTKQPSGALRIEATINDPVNYSEPIRLVRNWSWTPNVAWAEKICEDDPQLAAPK